MLDIILATHNHLEYTIQAIDALKQNTSIDYKLTVVDDSIDLTPSYISGLSGNLNYIRPIEKLVEGNQIINIGLKNTESNPVVFITQNTFVEPDWVAGPLNLFNGTDKIGLVGCKSLFRNGIIEQAGLYLPKDGDQTYAIGRNEPGHRYSNTYEVPAVGFCLVFINRLAFPDGLPTGLYPNGFANFDDIDTCFDVKKRGWKVLYCGGSIAYHIAGATKDEDWGDKLEANRRFFISRWGIGGTELKIMEE